MLPAILFSLCSAVSPAVTCLFSIRATFTPSATNLSDLRSNDWLPASVLMCRVVRTSPLCPWHLLLGSPAVEPRPESSCAELLQYQRPGHAFTDLLQLRHHLLLFPSASSLLGTSPVPPACPLHAGSTSAGLVAICGSSAQTLPHKLPLSGTAAAPPRRCSPLSKAEFHASSGCLVPALSLDLSEDALPEAARDGAQSVFKSQQLRLWSCNRFYSLFPTAGFFFFCIHRCCDFSCYFLF